MHTHGDCAELEQSVEETEFLVRSAHRVGVLAALTEEPCAGAELCEVNFSRHLEYQPTRIVSWLEVAK